MPHKYTEIIDSLLKISPMVFLAIGAKIAVQIKAKKATVIGSLVSLITGLTVTYFFSPYLEINLSKDLYPISIGLTAIMADKFIEFVVFRFDIGLYIEKALDKLIDKIKE